MPLSYLTDFRQTAKNLSQTFGRHSEGQTEEFLLFLENAVHFRADSMSIELHLVKIKLWLIKTFYLRDCEVDENLQFRNSTKTSSPK